MIGVPWAPFWAVLGGLLQYIPHFGPVLSLIGPAVAATVSGGGMRLVYVLILYAVIAVTDALLFQPLFMKRTARVPVWASVLAPLYSAWHFSFWGVVLAAPLLAILFAYRERRRRNSAHQDAGPRAKQPPLPRVYLAQMLVL